MAYAGRRRAKATTTNSQQEAEMNRFTAHPVARLFTLATVALVLALWATSCGDDPAAPQAKGSSAVLTFHGNHGLIASKFNFKIDTATIASLAYGEWAKTTVANGSPTIRVFSTSGTEVASQGVSLDSTHSTIVMFCGDDATRESFKVTSSRIVPSGGNSAIRIVHGSNNLGDVIIKINSTSGLAFQANNLTYRSGTNYVELPVSTTDSLLVMKPGTTDVLLTIPTKTLLSALKSYTIVLHGSTSSNADPVAKLASKLIQED